MLRQKANSPSGNAAARRPSPSLTPAFKPVCLEAREEKSFKRLLAAVDAITGLQAGVNKSDVGKHRGGLAQKPLVFYATRIKGVYLNYAHSICGFSVGSGVWPFHF